MKIFLITREPFPNGMAAVKRIIAYCKAWKKENIEVEIIIYTRTERYGIKPRNIIGHGIYETIPFRYIHDRPLRESFVLKRIWNDWIDFWRLKHYLHEKLKAGDVVYSYGINLKAQDLIQIIHDKKAYYFLELCELPFGTGDETKKRIRNRKKLERNILPLIDGIIVISDTLISYVKKYCSQCALITKIPILVEYDKYNMADHSEESVIPYIFHSGTLYEQKDGFLSMLKAFGKIVNDLPFDVKLISTGTPVGSKHETEIIKILQDYNISDKVVFTGYLNNEDVRNYLSKASFVIINKLPTQQNQYCFSTKLGEYMAASKAIITTNVGEAMNWLTHGENAYIVPTNDVEALGKAMKKLFLDKDLRKRLGIGANKACKTFFSIEANSGKLKAAITINQNPYIHE